MKKIMFLVNSTLTVYNLRKELVSALLNEGYEVWAALPVTEETSKLTDMGVKVVNTEVDRHSTSVMTDVKLFATYRKVIKQVKPDVILTYTTKPNVYGSLAAKFAKVPYIVNITGLGAPLENSGKLQTIMLFLYKHALSKAKMVFLQSKANQAFMLEHKVIKGDYELLPGSGVNVEHYRYLPYPMDENKIVFTFVGRVMAEKGIIYYIAAAKKLIAKHPEKELIFNVAGSIESEYQDKFDEALQENVVNYLGMVADIREVHKDTSVLVLPTYYPEGMANALLEAASSGRPLITTDRSGAGETTVDGKTGFVVPTKDENAVFEAMNKMVKMSAEERRDMGMAGREYVRKKFNRDIVVDAYLKMIANVS